MIKRLARVESLEKMVQGDCRTSGWPAPRWFDRH
jgi:hypothetical protein